MKWIRPPASVSTQATRECMTWRGAVTYAERRRRSRSRSSYFLTLPVDVFGSSPNSISLGALKPGRVSRENAISSAAVSSAPGRSATKPFGRSPHFSSEIATTAASSTSGCRTSALSTSIVEMFSPPEMMMSFARSRTSR